MKFNIFPVCLAFLLVGCFKNKEVKVEDSAVAAARNNPAIVIPIVEPTAIPEIDVPAEAKFCGKNQDYKMNLIVDNDYMDHRGKLIIDVLTLKKSREVHLYFQEGQITKKDHLDLNKSFCEVTTYINPKIGHSYKISGVVPSGNGGETVNHTTSCRELVINKSGIKNGEGVFTEISCTRVDFKEIKVEDVKEVMGALNITISEG